MVVDYIFLTKISPFIGNKYFEAFIEIHVDIKHLRAYSQVGFQGFAILIHSQLKLCKLYEKNLKLIKYQQFSGPWKFITILKFNKVHISIRKATIKNTWKFFIKMKMIDSRDCSWLLQIKRSFKVNYYANDHFPFLRFKRWKGYTLKTWLVNVFVLGGCYRRERS